MRGPDAFKRNPGGEPPDPSRRRFLRATGLAAAGVATAGLLASCSSGGEPHGGSTAPVSTGSSESTTPGANTSSPSTRPRELPSGLLSGMTLTSWTADELGNPDKGVKQIKEIAKTGANLLSLIPTYYQDGKDATVVYKDNNKTSTNDEIGASIDQAHALGMAVMLKPHVDPSKDDSVWRGDIGGNFSLEQRNQWFKSYKEFIVDYAKLAEKHGVEIFSVGCELKGLSGFADQWRDVVKAVREVYNGKVTYAANYDEPIQWYDAVDIMGVDAYPPEASSSATAASVATFWQGQIAQLGDFAKQTGKPFMLTEVGCSSRRGGWAEPNNANGNTPESNIPDQDVQAIWYNAVLNALAGQKDPKNVIGAAFWNWYPDPATEMANPAQDTSLSPQGKKAEVVFTNFNHQHHIQRRVA